ncbi:MAG: alpha/beta hydrolase [Lachnospiraceae bacterium]|nr:hypothetical protein [Muribaculaceae bacterium]MCM1412599.1 alpha/beta hydrolase [Lachnospiraceae bacterium]MCM1542417.1 alpha/beta hydrolase [Blautia sp.]
MEIKKFGSPEGKTVMLLHGNLMCWRQFEDVIPLLEKECLVFAVSFDGFDGTGKTTYTTAGDQAGKLAEYIMENCGGKLDMLFAESLGCGPAVLLSATGRVDIRHMILSGPEYLDYGIFNGLLLKIMPRKQHKTAKEKTMPAWAVKFMGQTQEGLKMMMGRIPDNISLESIRATWDVGLNLYRTELPVRPEAKVACWYGEKEGHMKKAVEKLKAAYPRLAVRCFRGYGHGDIINHPKQLADEMIRFMNQ